jgi:hypothetical protein
LITDINSIIIINYYPTAVLGGQDVGSAPVDNEDFP